MTFPIGTEVILISKYIKEHYYGFYYKNGVIINCDYSPNKTPPLDACYTIKVNGETKNKLLNLFSDEFLVLSGDLTKEDVI